MGRNCVCKAGVIWVEIVDNACVMWVENVKLGPHGLDCSWATSCAIIS